MKSTKPYLVRAIYDWCIEEGFTPHILVNLSDQVALPKVSNNNKEIVLNISPTSVTKLVIDDFVSFSARFNGISEDILIPIDSINSIYAQENGEGIHFSIKNKNKVKSKDKGQLNSSKEKKNSYLKLVK